MQVTSFFLGAALGTSPLSRLAATADRPAWISKLTSGGSLRPADVTYARLPAAQTWVGSTHEPRPGSCQGAVYEPSAFGGTRG